MSQKRESNAEQSNRRRSRQWRLNERLSNADHDIARINALSRAARTAWLGLLFFLAFVGVSLMGVKDADFFLREVGTHLPLIGISVPTYLFFALAPVLGTALFGYLHFYLLKLWQALGSARETHNGAPLSDLLIPWPINDLALGLRRDGALRKQPMRVLSAISTGALVFLATPVVLIGFWWRSMPAHDEVLTVFAIGVPLSLTIYIALRSRDYLRRETRQGGTTMASRRLIYVSLIVATMFSIIGWFRTEGTLGWYAEAIFDLKRDWIINQNWAQTPFPKFLARADLSTVDFASLPEGWQDRDDDRTSFFLSFCAREGIPQQACGAHDTLGIIETKALATARTQWCYEVFGGEFSCDSYFAEVNTRRAETWKADRATRIARLEERGYGAQDFRRAYLNSSRLEGVDLVGTRLEGSNLRGARMEKANLSGARLDQAFLTDADLREAAFAFARLNGAVLTNTRLEGAKLILARLDGAVLSGTRLEGADLSFAHLERALLRNVKFDQFTVLVGTYMAQAAIKSVDFSGVSISVSQIQSMFGDASVILPDTIPRPSHWPDTELDWGDFEDEWRLWQSDPTTYVPPQHRD